MHILNRQNKFGRRGVAVLIAISVSAILFLLVGGLLLGVVTTEKQRVANVVEVDLLGLENLGLQNAKLLLEKDMAEPQRFETDTGKVEIRSFNIPNDEERDSLYQSPLSPREGDRILRLISQMSFRGREVYMDSTYIVNTTPQQERCVRVHSRRGNGSQDTPRPALPSVGGNSPEAVNTQD